MGFFNGSQESHSCIEFKHFNNIFLFQFFHQCILTAGEDDLVCGAQQMKINEDLKRNFKSFAG